jgi:hypothetical protein
MNQEMKTVSLDNKRYYVIENGVKTFYLPSVTTIIGTFSDKTYLDEWRKNIGEENADRISTFAANRGTCMHTFNEIYLNKINLTPDTRLVGTLKEAFQKNQEDGFTNSEQKVGRNLFYNFYHAKFFKDITKVVMQEDLLYGFWNGGYAGRVDLIAELGDKLVIIDFKSSKKPKSEEDIEGYKLQISAYWAAYTSKYGITPDHCEIWISNEFDDIPQRIVLDKKSLLIHFKKFISYVKMYHEKFKSLTEDLN